MKILPTRAAADTPSQPPIDFDQMERDIAELGARAYAPKAVRETVTAEPGPKPHTALQLIAQAITQLTWTEAEALGAGVEKQGTVSGGEKLPLAAAIQAWARGWESFDA